MSFESYCDLYPPESGGRAVVAFRSLEGLLSTVDSTSGPCSYTQNWCGMIYDSSLSKSIVVASLVLIIFRPAVFTKHKNNHPNS